MEKKRYGWTEKGIIGGIFAPLGLIFLVVGLLFNGSVQASDERLGKGTVQLGSPMAVIGKEGFCNEKGNCVFDGSLHAAGRERAG